MDAKKETTDIIVVTEQLQQIDLIEKALKKALMVNLYQANTANDIKRTLTHEDIHLIIIDDDSDTIGVGSVKSAVNELKQSVPILQLRNLSSETAVSDFTKNGASLVCPTTDETTILHYTQLLLDYYAGRASREKDTEIIQDYQHKFNDLYQGLADPVCFLHDGVFVDCNPAFLRAFEVSDAEELDELTILNFVDRKEQTDLKNHLRKSTRRDLSASPKVFSLQTKLGKAVEYTIMSKPAKFEDEDVVQVYMRSTSESGGGGAGLYDETTGLSNKEQMGFFLAQKIEHFKNQGGEGMLAYVMIKNYRDIWAADGFTEAEKFIQATVTFVRSHMPAHTEISRYTDDAVLMFIPDIDTKAANELLGDLVRGLDKVTPEGMERMIEPICYVGFDKMNKDNEDYQALISQLFRTARGAALSESGARVGRTTATEVAEKDSKRLDTLQDAIKNERIQLRYQPIASFDPDSVERYRERLSLTDEEGQALELNIMVNVAERYQIMHRIDKWKMNHLFDKLLEADIEERKSVLIFIAISADSLKTPGFGEWLAEQMQHTGLGGEHFVFEMATDNIQNAYSGARTFTQLMRSNGAKIAVSRVGSLTNDNKRIIDDIQPDFIKLDLREIDTLDDTEEAEIMGEIREKADQMNIVLIAEYLESPAQLSRIWPYDVKFVQGDGMTPILDDMDFDFDEFDIG